MTLYNDNDPFVCAWLRELIAAGHLPPGNVLHAPIETLTHEHLSPYTTFHAFAGIGGWPLALRLAGWPDERPVWTGSCPCQPFSCAGKRLGTGDERHLWPAFRALIEQHRPPIVFGEQVAARAGREWLAGVRADLEALGYAVGGVDLCAAGEGAPHIRQRLYWVAFAGWQREGRGLQRPGEGACTAGERASNQLERSSDDSGLALPQHAQRGPLRLDGRDERNGRDSGRPQAHGVAGACGEICDAERGELATLDGREQRGTEPSGGSVERGRGPVGLDNPSPDRRQHEPSLAGSDGAGANSRWSGQESRAGRGWHDSTPHLCLDGKSRRIPLEPSLFPLVNGLQPARVGILRGAGNAIVPQLAATFVKAALGALGDLTR